MANITKIFLDGTEYNVGTDTDTKVTQTNSTYNANYRLLMSNTADNTTRTEGAKKSANFYANPSTGAFYAKGYNRTDITGNTLDVNTLTLSAGNVMALFYIERTDGGANNITNIPVAGKPFMLDVELIRWASTTDYITRQLFRNANNPANEYVRFCTNGTWGSWTTRVFTDTHWTTHLYAGSGTAANAETTNGNTKITVADNSTVRNNVTIKGTGATTVTSDANGVITVNSTNTTYSAATQSASGLMTASDKTKLDGIATGAEVNQNAFSNVTVGSTTIAADGKTDTLTIVAGSNITLTPDATNDKLTIAATDTTYSAATQSAAGLMSAADKTKLDGIATGAEVNQNAFSNVVVGSTTIAADGKTDTLTLTAGSNVTLTPDATNDKVTIASTDTKNTAGSTDTSNKIFLVGATSQAANPQTYSHDTAYVGTDGCLYSGGTKVLTAHQDISGKVSKSGDTMTGRLTTTKAINQIITGSGTAASDKGSGVSPRYFPAKWTFNTGSNCTNGDIFTIKIPVAGHDYGVFMSVNNGTNYYPIVLNGTGRLTSHYPNGTYIQVVFESSASAASIFPLNGGDARETVTGGAFRVINYCNTDIRPSAYCDTAAATAAKTASCTNYNLLSKSYLHIVVVNANTSQTALTLNVNGKGAKPIYINGSASSASNYTLPAGTYLVYYNGTNYYFRTDGKITGDITGNAATVGGHTVAKSVPSNAVFTDTTYSAATQSAAGLMSAADKTKLDGIATGAEVNQNAFSNVVVGSTTIAADGKTDTLTLTAGSNVTLTPDATNDKVTIASTDTKNTAGSTDTSNKIFLVGATSQAANPQTYSHDTAYVGTDGCLYSGGTKVLTAHQDISGKVSKSGDTMTGRLTTTKAINQIITGSGTAASDKGSGVSPRYFPAKWTFNTGSNCTNGDIFTIKIPVAGHDYGVFMSVNNGTNYYPIVLNGTGRLTSHYPNGTYIQVVFESSASAASIFPLNGGDARETVTGGAFRVINYCNTDIRPSAYCDTAAATAAKTASCTNYNLLSKSYLHIVVVNANTSQTALTLNVNGKGAKPIYINGSASSASNYTLPAGTYLVYYNGTNYYFRTDGKITGDITGNAATVGGHTVAKDVPSDAKFTDTTYSAVSKTANGLCPQLPNETTTTKYLRQDGTWQVPPQSSYTLPTASASVLGGVKVGTNLSISNGVLSATDTKYTAGAGLSLNGTTFKTDVGALQESCNKLPDEDTFVVDEFAAGSNYNLPSNNIFHIISIRGGWNQNSHTTQLALGVTVRAAYFRNYMNGAWQGWQSIINTTYGTVSKTAAGLCPQLPNETTTTKFLRQDGTWQVPVGVTVDSALSSTSTNPVQNKVINSALAGKQATLAVVTDSGSQSGVYSWNAIKVGRMATVTFSGQTSVTLPADFKPAITVYGTTGKSISTDGVMQASSTTATYTYITAS